MGEKVSYGLGNTAANLLLTTANMFIAFFYTEIGGIAAATVGTILLAARLLDGASDIAMGIIVDKTSSKHGKARPWLLWLAIPFGIAIALLFTSPDIGMTGKIVYAFITYTIALAIIYTAITVPYNSLIGLITQDQDERVQLSAFRTIFGMAGGVLVTIVTMPIVNYFGGGKHGWQMLSIIYGIAAVILYLICFKNTEERSIVEIGAESKVPVKKGLKVLFKNKYWLITISTILISFVASGLAGINVYYAKYILGNPAYMGMIGPATFVPIIVGVLLVTPLIQKFGKRNLAIGGSVLSVLGSIIMIINSTNINMILVGMVLRSLGIAPVAVASFAMLGDTVEYGEWKSGLRIEGLTFSAGTFGEKVGTGIGGVILGAILQLGGYVGGQAAQSDSALLAIKFTFIHLPIILFIGQIVLLYFYKLDSEYPQIVEELKNRKED